MTGVAYRVSDFHLLDVVTAGRTDQSLHVMYFILLSLLLHIFILKHLVLHNPSTSISLPARETSRISVNIESRVRDTPATDEPRHAVRAENHRPAEYLDSAPTAGEASKPDITRSDPEKLINTQEPDPAVIQQERSLPGIELLLLNTARQVEKTAKEMEALVDPKAFLTGSFREKLEQSRLEQQANKGKPGAAAGRVVYTNPMGDMVVRTGDTCMTIPALLVPYTFKEGNSIIAMPDACGNSKSDSQLAVEKIVEQLRPQPR